MLGTHGAGGPIGRSSALQKSCGVYTRRITLRRGKMGREVLDQHSREHPASIGPCFVSTREIIFISKGVNIEGEVCAIFAATLHSTSRFSCRFTSVVGMLWVDNRGFLLLRNQQAFIELGQFLRHARLREFRHGPSFRLLGQLKPKRTVLYDARQLPCNIVHVPWLV
jgi:hypothetical protein